MFAQGLGLDLFDHARFHVAQTERAIADADQAVDGQVDGGHGAADLAVLAFADADGQPGVGALNAVKHDRHRLKLFTVNGDATAQRLKIGVGGISFDPDAVFAQPAGRGQFKAALQLAVIGQEQQPLGVEVKAADRHDARQVGRQVVEHGFAALFVGIRAYQAVGLVVKPQAGGFGLSDQLARDHDLVGRFDVQGGRGDDFAVDRNLANLDHPLGFAARGDTGARQHLGDAFAFMSFFGLGFWGHKSHPWRGVASQESI